MIVILPYFLIAVGFVFAAAVSYGSKSPAKRLLIYPLIGSFILTGAFIIWGHFAISTSRSSTAAIGYIFLPFQSVAVAVAGFCVGWSFLCIFRFAIERSGMTSHRFTSIPHLVLALLILCLTGFTAQKWVARSKILTAAASATTDADQMEKILGRAIASHDMDVLSKLAKNSNTSTGNLIRIYDACSYKVADFSSAEDIVFLYLARNPQTPREILADLARSKGSSIRGEVGKNPSTPTETLYKLSKDKDNQVKVSLTTNPKMPRELLLQLTTDPDQQVRSYAQTYLRYRGYDTEPRIQ